MNEFTDQLGRKIKLASVPKRIISVVPSQTELLHDLGLDQEVVGITRFCIHPGSWFRDKTKIGGTKNINVNKVKLLEPDLIIANQEENDKNQIEELMQHYPVWISDVRKLEDALAMIMEIGQLVSKEKRATELKNKIENQFGELTLPGSLNTKKNKVAYVIWRNPVIVAAENTFINDMLSTCGFVNVFQDMDRYPEIPAETFSASNPDIIFLSSEPYPFKEKHVEEFRILCPGSEIHFVDGELFSWYGSRLLKAPDYFRSLVKQIQSGN